MLAHPSARPDAAVPGLHRGPRRPSRCLPRRAPAQGSFTNFESGQVRPLALSPDGTRLFAVNTPDNRLEIFDVERRRR